WPEGGEVQHQCSVIDGSWTCNPPGWCGCDCGRPLLVDGEITVAPLRPRSDWLEPLSLLRPDGCDAEAAATLAAYWLDIARYEHASVASFARFAGQLLQLGAPPSLLRATAKAMADEVVHARLAFGLAAAHSAAAQGPGPLPRAALAPGSADRRAIVEALIVEACIGETLAALEAREAALQAVDRAPQVAAVLARIADDELRHAALGWQALGWILRQGDAETRADLRRFADECLHEAMAAVREHAPAPQPSNRPRALRSHGLLDEAIRDSVRRRALELTVAPTVSALMGQPSAPSD
ncbi:MAG: ferritin-like domain-containing protein, partial [Myxococcales bacterium]|nr:ferritin-like domain-containing protein [Myxococcales bacterium]